MVSMIMEAKGPQDSPEDLAAKIEVTYLHIAINILVGKAL